MKIGTAHHRIRAAYTYNYTPNVISIANMLKMLSAADEIRDLRKTKVPGDQVYVVSQGLTRPQ